MDFEAQSHGLRTPCLRFAAGVTPEPRKTRFRLLASFAGRVWLPSGFQYEVSLDLTHHILPAKASLGAPEVPY